MEESIITSTKYILLLHILFVHNISCIESVLGPVKNCSKTREQGIFLRQSSNVSRELAIFGVSKLKNALFTFISASVG